MTKQQKKMIILFASIIASLSGIIVLIGLFPVEYFENNSFYYEYNFYDGSGLWFLGFAAPFSALIISFALRIKSNITNNLQKEVKYYIFINVLFCITLIAFMINFLGNDIDFKYILPIGKIVVMAMIAICGLLVTNVIYFLLPDQAKAIAEFQPPAKELPTSSKEQIIAQLQKLKELFDNGIITEEQYDEKRLKYLSELQNKP